MKRFCLILCLLLAALSASPALAEVYTDEWDNGVTLNFEIDASLLQPLDIFDVIFRFDRDDSSDEELSERKALLQKAMEITFKDAIPEIMEVPKDSASLLLKAYDNEWGGTENAHGSMNPHCPVLTLIYEKIIKVLMSSLILIIQDSAHSSLIWPISPPRARIFL